MLICKVNYRVLTLLFSILAVIGSLILLAVYLEGCRLRKKISNLIYEQFNSVFSFMARTGYQLISPSPWPIRTAFSVIGLCTSLFIFASEGLTSVFWGVCVFSIFFTAFNMCN